LFVTIHHCPAPGLSVTLGVRNTFPSRSRSSPAPPCTRPDAAPELSFEPEQILAWRSPRVPREGRVDVAMLPAGATSGGGARRRCAATVLGHAALHGPLPSVFVTIHH